MHHWLVLIIAVLVGVVFANMLRRIPGVSMLPAF